MPLTVSQIAGRIAKGGAASGLVIRRLRHWTRVGLLRTTGKKHPGTGRHRVYDDDALADALLLNAMADMGFQIPLMRSALKLAQHAKQEWREKGKQGVPLFLEIDTLSNGMPFPHYHSGNWFKDDADHVLIFNLTQLFTRLANEGE